jgi:hypothetical protein
MTISTATTEFDAREALRQHFEKNALTAFESCIEFLKQRDFYLHALHKLEQGDDLTTELQELKLVSKSTAKKICKQLAKDAEKSAMSVWDLNLNLSKLFKTTKQSIRDEYSLLPLFHIEYRADAKYGAVRLNVKTFRRNLTIDVEGVEKDCDKIHSQIILQILK